MNTASNRQLAFSLPYHPLLEEKETKSLLQKAQAGDRSAREKLVCSHLRLVYSVAQRFAAGGKELEDLFQVGSIGLLKAVERFDLHYQVCFSTYAVPMIMGEIRRYIRDDAPIRVSRAQKEKAALLRQTREKLTGQNNREPTISELTAALAWPAEEVVAALEAIQPLLSLNDVIYQEDGDQVFLLDKLSAQKGDGFLDDLLLKDLLETLPPRLQAIVQMRYFQDKTQSQVAALLGISQVQVSRLEKQAMNLLRENSQ
jgi:RNA polymerase sporulation-specific sigma factor